MSALMKKIIHEADELVTNSEFTTQEFIRWGISRGKIIKIVPGVDCSLFYPHEKPSNLLERYHLQNKKVIMTVGRLDERKGHDVVIRAMTHLTKRFPELVYIIVGKGREEERLTKLTKDLNLNDSIIFTGFVGDELLRDYYNLCDIFVLPNRETEQNEQLRGDYEGFGIVFLEASACGKPVIAGNSGGSGEAVANGITGILIDPKSEEAVAQAIERILTDKEYAERLGKAGRQRAEKEFDWQHIANTVQEIL
jgi:phosphatidylinositol alpha-1,6-mannosyltransferase